MYIEHLKQNIFFPQEGINVIAMKFIHTHTHTHTHTDMSLSRLREVVKDREAWHAVIHRVAKSWTQLSNWTTTYMKEAVGFPEETEKSLLNRKLSLHSFLSSCFLPFFWVGIQARPSPRAEGPVEWLPGVLLLSPSALLVCVVGPLHLRLFSSRELRTGPVGAGDAFPPCCYL